MKTTKHLQARSQQRAIRNDMLAIVITHGEARKLPGHAIEYYLPGSRAQALITEWKREIQLLERATGVACVYQEDVPLTTYRRHKKYKI